MIKLLVAGSRDYNDRETFNAVMDKILSTIGTDVHVIEGGARGADSMAREYAIDHGIEYTEVKPDWAKYGRAAGVKRNTLMVDMIAEENGAAVYFWDGKSRGTAQCINAAKAKNLRIRVWDTVNNRFMVA